MEKDKITFLKEKKLNALADKTLDSFIQDNYVENPIKAKFLAFKKVKEQIDTKELF